MNVGIIGTGYYLPEEIRTNDWWPGDVVENWRKKTPELIPEEKDQNKWKTEGQRLVLEAIDQYRNDPFYGSIERRIAPDHMLSSEMETTASKQAIDHAGIRKEQIDLVFSYSFIPDYMHTPNACAIHRKLDLPQRCLSMAVDAACNSFNMQVVLAEQMILNGQAKYGLLVQSTLAHRVIPIQAPSSAWFGDAATAVVVGPTKENRGILGRVFRTDGLFHDAIVTTVPGKYWYEDGLPIFHARDRDLARTIILEVADQGRQVVPEALSQAGYSPEDVNFYATHQATPWFRKLTQEYIGLKNSKFIDTFQSTASLAGCNIPFMLARGEEEGLLKSGDLVATYTGGSGLTWSSLILQWGS